jgi:Ca2+ transporting ATPase
MENAYTRTPAEVLQHFQVTEQKGLSETQVKDLRSKHGKNGKSGRNLFKSHTLY